ncbi:MAG: hypothetical protein AAFX93_19560 [Verrucomicrobiota bacterium]
MNNNSTGLTAVLGEMDRLGTQSIEVPEWNTADGEPFFVYWKPLSLEQVAKYVGKKAKDANARIICDHATTEDGAKLFSPSDFLKVSKSGHFKTINRIASAIIGEPEEEEEGEEPPLD